MIKSQPSVEITNHIKSLESDINIFKSTEIYSLHAEHLTELGKEKQIHKTMLKNSLITNVSGYKEATERQKYYLGFRDRMKDILNEAFRKRDVTNDAAINLPEQ